MAYANDILSAGGSLAHRLRSLGAAFAERRARYALYRKTQFELSQLTDRDLSDLGVSRLSIDDIAFEAAYGKK